jgi:hypothetical protein
MTTSEISDKRVLQGFSQMFSDQYITCEQNMQLLNLSSNRLNSSTMNENDSISRSNTNSLQNRTTEQMKKRSSW